ncbi:MAG: hypothetical protein M3Z36_11095 [Acidobacteriota bacterium]|nr:hypothetical protein [Acidobacteriota bacterium]
MPLNKDLREFVELLNSNEVEYLVVGAFAVAFHGFARYTADLDLLVRPTKENADRILRALSEFGFGKVGIQAADLCSPGMVVELGVKPNRIDLLTSIAEVSFEEAWASRSEADLDGIATNCIGRAALIRNKQNTGRAKDLGDAEELRKRTTEQDH